MYVSKYFQGSIRIQICFGTQYYIKSRPRLLNADSLEMKPENSGLNQLKVPFLFVLFLSFHFPLRPLISKAWIFL